MTTDRSTVNLVIGGLVLITLALLAVAAVIAIDGAPGDVPEAIYTLLGTTVGALAAMLARTSTTPDAPRPVPPPQVDTTAYNAPE